MANNRMVLVCNVCYPELGKWQYHTKGVLTFAKWYPDGAYYNLPDKEVIQGFLEAHAHTEIPSDSYTKGAGQPNPVRLEYEDVDMPILTLERKTKDE